MNPQITVVTERIDDIVLLLHVMQQMVLSTITWASATPDTAPSTNYSVIRSITTNLYRLNRTIWITIKMVVSFYC
jgi:hypothetical protein